MSNSNELPKITPNPVLDALKAAQPNVQSAVGTTQPEPVKATGLDPNLAKLMAEMLELKAKVLAGETKAAQKVVEAKAPVIDWTKITEKDIINLSIDIPVIEQDTPEYMNVHLLDRNYIARWIHILPQRLGVCLAGGYTYVKHEDMDPRYPVFLNFDTSGNYSAGDVVCLKILKSRYYPAIKANYMKTMAIHGRAKLDQAIARGRAGTQLDRQGNEIKTNESIPEVIDPRKINFYDPGDEQAPGEREWTREMVS